MAHVLILDDERAVLLMAQECLADAGHRVTTVSDTKAAREALETGSYDVVLTDIFLPDGDGISILKKVRERWPEIPVIMLTRSPDLSTATDAVRAGAFEYLTKPMSLASLLEVTERAAKTKAHTDAQRHRQEQLRLQRLALEQAVVDRTNDLTQSRASLQRSEAHLRRAQDVAKICSWELNLHTRELYWSSGLRGLLGLEENTAPSYRSVLKATHPEDRELVWWHWLGAVRGGAPYDIEHRIETGGEVRWVRQIADIQFQVDGTPCRGVGILQDITERKQAQLAPEQAMADIQRLSEQLESENISLRKEIRQNQFPHTLIGDSPSMQKVLAEAVQVAGTDSGVLIQGETGTGKKLLAKTLHAMSPRNQRAFIRVHCAAIPAEQIEGELFGYSTADSTGRIRFHAGKIELADGGILLLQEVGELPMEIQTKFLRVIEDGVFVGPGSNQPIRVDVRILATTQRDLAQAVAAGTFRKDLFYHLNAFPMQVPPLRDRQEDLPALVWSFVREFSTQMGKTITRIPREDLDKLAAYTWPGNVRELRNVVEQAMIRSDEGILTLPLPSLSSADGNSLTLDHIQRTHILRVLKQTEWRIRGPRGAARLLGLKESTLRSRMDKLGIHRPKASSEKKSGL